MRLETQWHLGLQARHQHTPPSPWRFPEWLWKRNIIAKRWFSYLQMLLQKSSLHPLEVTPPTRILSEDHWQGPRTRFACSDEAPPHSTPTMSPRGARTSLLQNWGHNAGWDIMPRCAVALFGAALAQSGIELVEVSRCLLLTFKECLEKNPTLWLPATPLASSPFSHASRALQFSRECAGWVRCKSSRLLQLLRIFGHTVVSPPPTMRAPVEMTMVCCSWSGTLCRALVVHSSRTGSGAAGSVIAGSSQSLQDFVPFALPRPPTEAAAAAHSREGRAWCQQTTQEHVVIPALPQAHRLVVRLQHTRECAARDASFNTKLQRFIVQQHGRSSTSRLKAWPLYGVPAPWTTVLTQKKSG